MTNLSKAFDCIPHDLLTAKLEAYLKNKKQCVKINNTYSDLLGIISGVPQGSIVGPILLIFSSMTFSMLY